MARFALIALGLTLFDPTPANSKEAAPSPASAVQKAESYDLVIRGGTIYDGSGGRGVKSGLTFKVGRIGAVGDVGAAPSKREIGARGLAVAPGFINMLSW